MTTKSTERKSRHLHNLHVAAGVAALLSLVYFGTSRVEAALAAMQCRQAAVAAAAAERLILLATPCPDICARLDHGNAVHTGRGGADACLAAADSRPHRTVLLFGNETPDPNDDIRGTLTVVETKESDLASDDSADSCVPLRVVVAWLSGKDRMTYSATVTRVCDSAVGACGWLPAPAKYEPGLPGGALAAR